MKTMPYGMQISLDLPAKRKAAIAAMTAELAAFENFKAAYANNPSFLPGFEDFLLKEANDNAFEMIREYMEIIENEGYDFPEEDRALISFCTHEIANHIPSRWIIAHELNNIRKMAEAMEKANSRISAAMIVFYAHNGGDAYCMNFPADEFQQGYANQLYQVSESIDLVRDIAIGIGEGF